MRTVILLKSENFTEKNSTKNRLKLHIFPNSLSENPDSPRHHIKFTIRNAYQLKKNQNANVANNPNADLAD